MAGPALFVTIMCCLPVRKLICTFRDTVGLHGSMPPTAQVGLIGLLSVTIRNRFALHCTAAVKRNTEKSSLTVQCFASVTCS